MNNIPIKLCKVGQRVAVEIISTMTIVDVVWQVAIIFCWPSASVIN